jgi:hypothetical protein
MTGAFDFRRDNAVFWSELGPRRQGPARLVGPGRGGGKPAESESADHANVITACSPQSTIRQRSLSGASRAEPNASPPNSLGKRRLSLRSSTGQRADTRFGNTPNVPVAKACQQKSHTRAVRQTKEDSTSFFLLGRTAPRVQRPYTYAKGMGWVRLIVARERGHI